MSASSQYKIRINRLKKFISSQEFWDYDELAAKFSLQEGVRLLKVREYLKTLADADVIKNSGEVVVMNPTPSLKEDPSIKKLAEEIDKYDKQKTKAGKG